ncbi:hypothetical protein Tco_0002002 [Tanacetum coccineum]
METHLAPKSSVQSARSYPTEDSQCSSHPLKSINDIQTCSKETNNSQKNQPQTVIEIGTPKSKEPEQTLEDEFKDLHLNLPVLEVLAHALMYNAILDKYIESLKLGKNGFTFIQGEMPEKIKDLGLFTLPCRLGDSKPFDTLADLGWNKVLSPRNRQKFRSHIGRLKRLEDFNIIDMDKDPATPLLVRKGFLATANVMIDCKKAKIAVGEGITSQYLELKKSALVTKKSLTGLP